MRKNYHVTKTTNGWQVKREKTNIPVAIGKTKSEVVKKAIALAKKDTSSSLKIHLANGRFQEERTYPRKSDPFPPKG